MSSDVKIIKSKWRNKLLLISEIEVKKKMEGNWESEKRERARKKKTSFTAPLCGIGQRQALTRGRRSHLGVLKAQRQSVCSGLTSGQNSKHCCWGRCLPGEQVAAREHREISGIGQLFLLQRDPIDGGGKEPRGCMHSFVRPQMPAFTWSEETQLVFTGSCDITWPSTLLLLLQLVSCLFFFCTHEKFFSQHIIFKEQNLLQHLSSEQDALYVFCSPLMTSKAKMACFVTLELPTPRCFG